MTPRERALTIGSYWRREQEQGLAPGEAVPAPLCVRCGHAITHISNWCPVMGCQPCGDLKAVLTKTRNPLTVR